MKEKQKPQLVIFAGANGAGKTSFYYKALNILPSLQSIPYVNPDIIQRDKFPDNPLLAGREAISLRNSYLDKKRNFALETTLSGTSECKFIEKARNEGYKINLVYIGLSSPEMHVMRIANRVRLGGHNIENTDVYRRVGRSLDNLKKISGNVDRMYVLDNTEMPFRTIIINKNKVNTFVSKNIPDWTGSLLEKLTINEYKSKIKLLSPETKSMLLKNLEKKTEPKKDSGMER